MVVIPEIADSVEISVPMEKYVNQLNAQQASVVHIVTGCM
jgi:hypothetical protein